MILLLIISAALVVFIIDAWLHRSLVSAGLALLTFGACVLPRLNRLIG